MDAGTAVYLLGSILNRLNSTDNRDQFNEVRECICYLRTQNNFPLFRSISFIQVNFIRVGNDITQKDINGKRVNDFVNVIGSKKTTFFVQLLILCYTQKTELEYTFGKMFLLAY